MQLFLLADNGLILGGTSLEGTLWRMSDAGYCNETLVRVKLDIDGHPTKYRMEISNRGLSMEGPVMVPPLQNDSVIFWPGTMFLKHDWTHAYMLNAQ